MHISNALKAHSKTIHCALNAYNQAALVLSPPWPKLTWTEIVEYTTISEFELLQCSAHEDIHNLEWADARNCHTTICHLKLIHAQEEVYHLNVEVK